MLLFLLLAFAMTVAFVLGMQKALAVGWREAARPLVVDYVDRLVADLGSPPSIERAQTLVQRLPLSVRIKGPLTNWDSHPAKRHPEWDRHRHAEPEQRVLERTLADGHHIEFGLGDLPFERQPGRIGWITLAALLALIAAAYLWVRRLLRPLDDIRAGAQRFGTGDLTHAIPVRRADELGDLARQINTMARDIHGMLEAKRALLLAISHELRSPLTRARVNAELLPETDEVLTMRRALLADLGEMRDLISDLLESERLAGRHTALNLEPTNLTALVADVVVEFDADDGRASVVVGLLPDLPPLLLDRVRLRLLLRNLLDNALRHSADAPTAPEISLRRDAEGVQMRVRDHGPGVADKQLSRLTEPFYRTDDARQRTTGGVGLGLHLCRLVAEAHGGRLSVRNARPGLEVTVWLPLPRPAARE